MLLEVEDNVVHVSDDFDPDETQSYSGSHPDPGRFAYGFIVVSSRLRVNDLAYFECPLSSPASLYICQLLYDRY